MPEAAPVEAEAVPAETAEQTAVSAEAEEPEAAPELFRPESETVPEQQQLCCRNSDRIYCYRLFLRHIVNKT